jgi:hypothetical protein
VVTAKEAAEMTDHRSSSAPLQIGERKQARGL